MCPPPCLALGLRRDVWPIAPIGITNNNEQCRVAVSRPPRKGVPLLRSLMEATAPPIMTIAEVAEYLRIPRASAYKLAQQGRIPCQKVGRHWRFRKEAVDLWLGQGMPEPATDSERWAKADGAGRAGNHGLGK